MNITVTNVFVFGAVYPKRWWRFSRQV